MNSWSRSIKVCQLNREQKVWPDCSGKGFNLDCHVVKTIKGQSHIQNRVITKFALNGLYCFYIIHFTTFIGELWECIVLYKGATH